MPRFLRSILPAAVALAVAAGCGASKQHAKIAQAGKDMRVELAETYIAKGVKEAAIPLLRRAITESPKDPKVRVLYATVLRDLGLYPQAERHFQFALDLEPNYAPAHAGLGILYDLQRRPEKALKHHRRAVRLQPGFAPYRNNLGFSLFLAGDTEGAIRQYENALSLDPGLTVAYNNLGFAYGRAGKFDRAERTFRTVGNRPATLINMSLVYDEHGEHDRAREMREEAYALAPDLRPDPTEMQP